jgi:hypothetical protein
LSITSIWWSMSKTTEIPNSWRNWIYKSQSIKYYFPL